MESEEHQERWPVIGQSDVADVCREICESIIGLERAFEAGELWSRLTSGCFEQVLGPHLYETYGKLADNTPGPLHHLRVDAVRALLAQLQNDLRVKYPGLKRRRGGRVQVTSIIAPELHETKLQGIKLAEEFVFLSPLSLAEFVDSLRGRTLVSSISGTPPFALAPLWDCLEMKPADVPQLASELKRIMFRALTGTPDSPLGPMVRVPLPIRHLIRLFVETHAITSTSRLRERERGSSSGEEDQVPPSQAEPMAS